MIDKETEYKALKACLNGDENLCDKCKLGDVSYDCSSRTSRLLELHGEMVARKIADRQAEAFDVGAFVGTREMLDIAKSVGK